MISPPKKPGSTPGIIYSIAVTDDNRVALRIGDEGQILAFDHRRSIDSLITLLESTRDTYFPQDKHISVKECLNIMESTSYLDVVISEIKERYGVEE